MTDALLPWYDRELEYFRQLSSEFAARYPKVAGRLSLEAQGAKDPHVERMIQAFAFLNARIRYKLDDDFPEIADAMLSVLYPHFLAPTPSMSIVDFQLKKGQADLPLGHAIPAETILETEPVDGEKCLFRTCSPVELWPFRLETAVLQSRPFHSPWTPRSQQAVAQLRLELRLADASRNFRDFAPGRLRFYLHGPQFQHMCSLYELLCRDVIEIVIAKSADDPEPMVLPATALRPVGFDRDDAVLPDSPRSFPGYRLLTEFFSFPRKFLFLELTGLDAGHLQALGSTLSLHISLRETNSELERLVTRDTFRLGATPVINLFSQPADPFELSHRQSEYRIVPDARREQALEIYSIESVELTTDEGESRRIQPFYSTAHADEETATPAFWHAVRRPGATGSDAARGSGSELYLSLVDSRFSPLRGRGETLHLETTCFNRDLPGKLPFGGPRPQFALRDGDEKIGVIQCLVPPTSTIRADYRRGNLWKLISHLSLNHLSIEGGASGAAALREILKLYDVTRSSETQELISGLTQISRQPSVARVSGAPSGFCRGVDVELTLNTEKFTGHGAYLFAAVLERFLGFYVTLNSFTRVTVRKRRPHGPAESWTWPPRSGDRQLL